MNKYTATDLFKIFAALIFVASAILTFAFFWTFLPALVPAGVLDDFTAAFISGGLGVLIFDAGALAWLKIYLDGCQNNDQRNVAMSTSVLDVSGSAVASFAQIILTGTGLVALDPNTQLTIGWASLLAVAGTLVFNFVSVWRFHKNSDASKLAIREANRLGKIREAEEAQEDHLDDLIAQKVHEKLAAVSDALADQQADRIVAERVRLEKSKNYESPQGPERPASEFDELPEWLRAEPVDNGENPT